MKIERRLKMALVIENEDQKVRNARGFCFSRGKQNDVDWARV